jgi:hypothetical protein
MIEENKYPEGVYKALKIKLSVTLYWRIEKLLLAMHDLDSQ